MGRNINWKDMRIGGIYLQADTREMFAYLGSGYITFTDGNGMSTRQMGYLISKIGGYRLPPATPASCGMRGRFLVVRDRLGCVLGENLCVRRVKPYASMMVGTCFPSGVEAQVNSLSRTTGLVIEPYCEIRFKHIP